MAAPVFDLQPMSIGDILDRTVRLYQRYFLHLIGIASVPYLLLIPIIVMVGSTVLVTRNPAAFMKPGVILGLGGLGLVFLWLNFASMGALARSISERFLGGAPTIWAAYQVVLRRSLALMWAYFLFGLVMMGGLLLAGVLIGISVGVGGAAGLVVAIPVGFVTVVALVVLSLRLLLVTQVIVIEDRRGTEALGRSWDLMRGNFWRGVLILIFAGVLGAILGLVLSLPAGVVAGFALNPAARSVLQQVVQQLGNILAVPFGSIAFTLLYYDSRIRKEAFDLEMMARNLGAPGRPAAPGAAGPMGAWPRPSPVGPPPAPPGPAPARAGAQETIVVPPPPPPAAPPHPAGPPPGTQETIIVPPAPSPPAAAPPRPIGAFKLCPKCGAQVSLIRPTCPSCGAPVPFRPAG